MIMIFCNMTLLLHFFGAIPITATPEILPIAMLLLGAVDKLLTSLLHNGEITALEKNWTSPNCSRRGVRLRGAFSLFGMKTATAIDVGAPRHDGSTGVAADILNGIICYLIGIICYLGRVTTVTRCSSSASTRGKPSGELGSSREVSPASPRV